MRRLLSVFLVVLVAGCASIGSGQSDLRVELATAALLLASLNDQGTVAIDAGEVSPERARAMVEASNAGQQALEGCRLVALDVEDGTVGELSAFLCLAATVNAALRLEGAITADDDGTELTYVDALLALANAALLPDERMVALVLEAQTLPPGERLSTGTVNWAFQEMRVSNLALRVAAGSVS